MVEIHGVFLLNCTIVQATRVGKRRTNQDSAGHWRTAHSALMVVADGLGGHPHGEVAAQVAVEYLGTEFRREARPVLPDPQRFLAQTLADAHAVILHEAQQRGLVEAPRTVIVACVVQNGHAYWSHVGDCRLYLVRGGRIVMRTRDHTVVQQLLDAGRIREEAMSTHPERNRLLQCLGGFQSPRPDAATKARLARNDVLILCSDGLWGPLTQRQLLHPLVNRSLEEAVPELVALAELRGGPHCDNVTVVAMSWGENEVAEPEESHTVPSYDLPTDVQDFTATDLDFLRMSDEDIEKAIAELKAALRKNQRPE